MKMEDILHNLLDTENQKTASVAPAAELSEEQVIEKIAADLSADDIANLEKIAEELETEKTAEDRTM